MNASSPTSRGATIRVELTPVLIAEGDYRGQITKLERGRAPWAPRKLARWEQEEHRERRQDWHAYYHVRLQEGCTPATHEALRAWADNHGILPVLVHACRYSCRHGSATPLPIRSQASNLLRLLRLVRPGTTMVGVDIPFDEPLGLGGHLKTGQL